MTSGIYKISCTANGKYYYGSSDDVAGRKRSHRSLLRKGEHDNILLQRAWNKYGEQSFVWTIDMICAPEQLLRVEQVYLDIYVGRPDCMNIAEYAGASFRGKTHQQHSLAKMSAAKLGNRFAAGAIHSADSIAASSGKGKERKTHTDDHCRRLSDSLKAYWAKKRETK